MKFSHTISTTATPENIWDIWTDVENWADWDKELESARLKDQVFDLGAKGVLRPKSGPASSFVVSEYEPTKGYAFTTQLPLCELVVRRQLNERGDGLEFTHEVSFIGPLSSVFGRLLGRRFRIALPGVMENVRSIAERRH